MPDISTVAEFKAIADAPSANYTLQSDIDLSAETPTSWPTLSSFSGTLDGNGHTITGIGGPNGHLFGTAPMTLRNVTLSGVTTRPFLGNKYGTTLHVEDVTTQGQVSAGGALYGGPDYRATGGTLRRCVNYADISGGLNTGGFVGNFDLYSGTGVIEDCVNFGTVSTARDGLGGIVGVQNPATITRCANYGTINGQNAWYRGGISGWRVGGTVTESFNAGPIYGGTYTGPITGRSYAGSANYYDSDTTLVAGNGTGLPTAQAKDLNATNYPAWTLSEWDTYQHLGDGYPIPAALGFEDPSLSTLPLRVPANGEIELRYIATGASTVDVYRATEAGTTLADYELVASPAAGVESYVDTGLDPATTYHYRIDLPGYDQPEFTSANLQGKPVSSADAYPRDVGTGTTEDDADPADAATVGAMVDNSNARNYVLDGFTITPDWTAGTLDVTGGKARITLAQAASVEGQQRSNVGFTVDMPVGRTLTLPTSGTADVFLTFDPATNSAPNLATLTGGQTPGDPSLHIASVDVDGQTLTPENRAPTGTFDGLTATGSFTDPAGIEHTNELADLADIPTIDGTFPDVTATNSLTDPAGVAHTGELADLADLPDVPPQGYETVVETWTEPNVSLSNLTNLELANGRLESPQQSDTGTQSLPDTHTGDFVFAFTPHVTVTSITFTHASVSAGRSYTYALHDPSSGTDITSTTISDGGTGTFTDLSLTAGQQYLIYDTAYQDVRKRDQPTWITNPTFTVNPSTGRLDVNDTYQLASHFSEISMTGGGGGGTATLSLTDQQGHDPIAVRAEQSGGGTVTVDIQDGTGTQLAADVGDGQPLSVSANSYQYALSTTDASVERLVVTYGGTDRPAEHHVGGTSLTATTSFTDPAGTVHTGELADLADIPTIDGTFADVTATNSLTDPAGVAHTGELADLADIPAPTPNEAFTQTVTTDTTLTNAVETVLVDASTAPVTVTLPAPSADVLVNVKRTDASANAVTVATPGTETIDGAADLSIAAQYDSYTVVSDGTNYYII